VRAEIGSGKIRGGHSRGALAFKGIPYAGPVSGSNRFKAAPKVTPWTGVRDAIWLGPPAMQGPGTTYGQYEPAYSENCLVLNVWTPAVNDGGKRPVMFYCHGGGFATGSGGQSTQDGAHLAANYDVVVVATNHRLGILGYLYLGELGGEEYATSGNQGMLDIVAALSWVKENIATFGGDPNNVMAFGESGGGNKTCTLMAMPSAHGLFHKAGVQSGAMLRGLPKEIARRSRHCASRPEQAQRSPRRNADLDTACRRERPGTAVGANQGILGQPSSCTRRHGSASCIATGWLGSGGGGKLSAPRSLRPLCARTLSRRAAPRREHAGRGRSLPA
jgi:carboxylesterase type B